MLVRLVSGLKWSGGVAEHVGDNGSVVGMFELGVSAVKTHT